MSEYVIKITATNYAAAVEFPYYYRLWYRKELNKISAFRVTVFLLTTEQKALVKEGNLIYLLYGSELILKGEIRNVDKNDADEEWTLEGNGMEIKLHDRTIRGRKQWNDDAADAIVKELISGIMDEGTIEPAIKVGFRAEEDSVLRSIMSLANAIGYDWYVDQAVGFDTDRLNFVAHYGSETVTETFSASETAIDIIRHKDVDKVYNVIRVMGYGDGVNQIMSESFAATANRATLAAEISADATSLTVAEAIDSFPSSGDLRCGREWIKYSAKNNETKTFSGLTRGHIPVVNPPTDNPYYIGAYAHKKGAQIIDLQYSASGYPSFDDAQSGSSIAVYGLRENVYPEQSIMHQTTVDLLAQRLINKYERPIERAEFIAAQEVLIADIGDHVRLQFLDSLYPSATLYPSVGLYPGHLSATLRVIAYEFNEDEYTLRLTLGGASEDFLEDISQLQKNLDTSSVYGLGNTCIYSIQSYENCDAMHPLHLRFFLPEEIKAINHVFLSFKIKPYRAYTGTTPAGGGGTTPAGGGHTTPAGGGSTSGATGDYFLLWTIGTYMSPVVYVSLRTHYHSGPSHTHSGPSHTHTIPFVEASLDYEVGLVGNQHGLRCSGGGSGNWATTNSDGTGATGPGGTGNTGDASGNNFISFLPITDVSQNEVPTRLHTHTYPAHTHTVLDHEHTISDHQHAMTYQIYEASHSSPSIIVKVGEDGGSLTEVSDSPFTEDQNKCDITTLVKAEGVNKWIDVEFTPNQVLRIEANCHVQGFIESK